MFGVLVLLLAGDIDANRESFIATVAIIIMAALPV